MEREGQELIEKRQIEKRYLERLVSLEDLEVDSMNPYLEGREKKQNRHKS